ncbi:MAG: hypothetical protein P9M14_11300 [Candidatus Alcyoniella australis]|nr:hypothetical protein [Candidatus Alcyoniella australis]
MVCNLLLAGNILTDQLELERAMLAKGPALPALNDGVDDIDLYQLNDPLVESLLRIAENSNNYSLHRYLGEVFLERPDYQQLAEQEFLAALDAAQYLPDGLTPYQKPPRCPHMGLGAIYMNRGDLRAAAEHFETYIANSDDNAAINPTRWQAALLRSKLGDYQAARYQLDGIVRTSDKDAQRLLARLHCGALKIRQRLASA